MTNIERMNVQLDIHAAYLRDARRDIKANDPHGARLALALAVLNLQKAEQALQQEIESADR